MTLKQFLAVSAVLLLITSCKKDVEQDIAPQATTADTAATVPIASDKDPYILDKHIASFIKRREFVKLQLPKLNQKLADSLFDSYVSENGKAILALDSIEDNLLANFYNYYTDEHSNAKTPPDSIQRKEKLLKSAGLELWEIGEGYVEIRTIPKFYLTIFKDYVTPDYKSYIEIIAEEDKDLYSADAGIAISFEAVGKRVLNWENFIAKYPDSKLISKAKDAYIAYQGDYFFGEDNTPTMEDNSTKLYPENEAELKKFINKHTGSFTAQLAKMVLDNTALTRDELYKVITKAQEKYLGLK